MKGILAAIGMVLLLALVILFCATNTNMGLLVVCALGIFFGFVAILMEGHK